MIKKINILSLLFVFSFSLVAFSSFSDRVQAGCWIDGDGGSPYYDANDNSCTEMEAFVLEETKIPDEFDICDWYPEICVPIWEPYLLTTDTTLNIVFVGGGGGDGGGGGG
ncbi:MAG: hypothetical protein Q7R72_00465, partial [bacterium]|nr:hypothetical protein [bacterium]